MGNNNREEYEARLDQYEKLRNQIRPDGRNFTIQDCARELGVTQQTAQKYETELKSQGRLRKNNIRNINYNQQMRDEIFERHVDTYEMIRRAILRTERTQQMLDAELGFDGEPCPACGRARIGNKGGPDFLKWQTAFKGGETMNNQIVTLAKMLGQISDNQIVLVNQIDEDVMLIMEELASLDRGMAQRIFNKLIERSTRRRQRLPEFTEIIDGQYQIQEANPAGAARGDKRGDIEEQASPDNGRDIGDTPDSSGN